MVDVTTSTMHHSYGCRAYRMSYRLVCERLCMVELDDCNILQLGHLIASRMSRAHDSLNA
jgi:hypothetical protein